MAISALTISASVVAAGAPVQRSSSGQVVSDAPLDERGVTAPATVVSQPVAKYPAAARAAEVERDVPVDIVVDARGEVIEARVEGHVGYGLDEAALETVRRTRFRPAQRDGQAVAVRMRWTMQFRLE